MAEILADSQTISYTPYVPDLSAMWMGQETYPKPPSFSVRRFLGGRTAYRELSVLGQPVGDQHEPTILWIDDL